MLCDQSLFFLLCATGSRSNERKYVFHHTASACNIISLHLNGLATHLTYSDGIIMCLCVCVHILNLSAQANLPDCISDLSNNRPWCIRVSQKGIADIVKL